MENNKKIKNTFGLPPGRTLAFDREEDGEVSNARVLFVDGDNFITITKLTKEQYNLDLAPIRARFKTKLKEVGANKKDIKAAEQAAIERLDEVYASIAPEYASEKAIIRKLAKDELDRQEQANFDKEFAEANFEEVYENFKKETENE